MLLIAGETGDPTGDDPNGDENEDAVKPSPRFIQYVKEKKFEMKDFPQAGLNNVVVVPANKETMVSQRPPYIARYIYIYSSAPLHTSLFHHRAHPLCGIFSCTAWVLIVYMCGNVHLCRICLGVTNS